MRLEEAAGHQRYDFLEWLSMAFFIYFLHSLCDLSQFIAEVKISFFLRITRIQELKQYNTNSRQSRKFVNSDTTLT